MTDKASEGGRDLDLEKELSCSICTDVLYRPLTLLDCLHSFCGSCLKEWFAWQASSKGHVFSCPACRAVVRDTRPNATLSTLLDMFLQAHPDKGKTAQEKLDMDKTYKPGDNVIPPVDLGQVSDDEDEEEQQLLAQARELSLNDVGLGNRSTPEEHQRHARQTRRRDDSPRRAQVDALSHQSSIRSLLSQSDMDLGDMEDEIMRHIIDHGLLDGVDLNNLTPDQEDAITDSIARAYRARRRQERRDRHHNRDRSAARASPRTSTHRHSPHSSSHRQSPSAPAHRHSPSGSSHRRTTSTTTTLNQHALATVQTQPSPARRRAASAHHSRRLDTSCDRHRHLIPDSSARPLNHSSPALPLPSREQQAPNSSQRHSPTELNPSPLTPTNSAFHFNVPPASIPLLPHVPDPASYTRITLSSYCDVCHYSIPPSHARFHCNTCNKGNYDICNSCYHSLVNTGKISRDNGPSGWRRCLRSHRMSIVGYEDREGGPQRVVVKEMVGGWALKDDLSTRATATNSSAQQQHQDHWRWKEHDGTAKTASSSANLFSSSPHVFPPSGGIGLKVQALWSYFPSDEVQDELRFPRNAIITEVEDINGDWFWGVYCGGKGLFPGNYVRVV
ncbi:hypothetical protein QM012_000708 [Aureobasidium pullulans]|uniref:RING-type domain-containing protein n=1 Tax=Aureobasidium pullulans TaxID=5580 RepID=A0ABR0TWG3_AURPU